MSLLTLSTTSIAASTKHTGEINSINTAKRNISINNITYKLSNTVKVYGFNDDKYINVKHLTASMFIEYKYSKRKSKNTISEIWAIPN